MKLIFALFVASCLVISVYGACSDYSLCSECMANNCSYCNTSGFGGCYASCSPSFQTNVTTCDPVCVLANSFSTGVANPFAKFTSTAMTFNPSISVPAVNSIYAGLCKTYLTTVFNASAVNCSAPVTNTCPAPAQACTDALLKFSAAFICKNCDSSVTSANIANYSFVCDDDCTTLFNACPVPSNVSCDTIAYYRASRTTFCNNVVGCQKFANIASTYTPPNPCVAPTPTGATGATGSGFTVVLSVVTLFIVALIV